MLTVGQSVRILSPEDGVDALAPHRVRRTQLLSFP